MIWNDDKIRSRFAVGMMHGVAGPSGAGNAEAASGGDLGGPGGFGNDFGGGDSSVDAAENDPGVGTSGFGSDKVGDLESMYARFLDATPPAPEKPGFISKVTDFFSDHAFALGGTVLGGLLGGAPGAAALGRLGGKFDSPAEQDALGQAPPGGFAPGSVTGQTAPGQAAPDQAAPGLAGVSLGGLGLQGGQLGGGGGGGGGGDGGGAPAQQLAAAGRVSGVAQQAPQLAGGFQLPAQQFINRSGPLPTVNLGAFPNYIGRTV